MAGVDALACSLGPLIAKYLTIPDMLRERDQLQRPKEYNTATLLAGNTSKLQ